MTDALIPLISQKLQLREMKQPVKPVLRGAATPFFSHRPPPGLAARGANTCSPQATLQGRAAPSSGPQEPREWTAADVKSSNTTQSNGGARGLTGRWRLNLFASKCFQSLSSELPVAIGP